MRNSTPLRIWLLAAGCSVALAAVVISFSTPTVLADATLARPAATAPPAAPVASATPALLAPQETTASRRNDKLKGVASWYGGVFNGRRTASGEVYDMNEMTACHPTLPFGTKVRVTNLDNHKAVVVRITDRGYLYAGRIIDLSFAAAEKLAMTKAGLAHVNLQVISMGKSRHRG